MYSNFSGGGRWTRLRVYAILSAMDFLNTGIPIGQYWGINVRIHFTLLIYAYFLATSYGEFMFGLAVVAGLWVCILLHEFGHALAAHWCDGECEEIMLWPLGGLAFARPAWHPTAHLITTVAGPFVSLVLWLAFWGFAALLEYLVGLNGGHSGPVIDYVYGFAVQMQRWNLWLLLFNVCIPAFPMDGGRMLRDLIWHWMSAETATIIAIRISQLIAAVSLAWAFAAWSGVGNLPAPPLGPIGMLILAGFILFQARNERFVVAAEAGGAYSFNLRERIHRGVRRRSFHRAVRERIEQEAATPFHRCEVCGKTDHDDGDMEFRVCTDCANGEEYCPEHIDNHPHVTT